MEYLVGILFMLGAFGILKGIESFENKVLDIIVNLGFTILCAKAFGDFLLGVFNG